MTPRRSRGRRLVLAAAAAVVLVLAGCSEVKNNGQNSLAAQGPAGPEDRQPLHPDPDHRDHRRHRRSSSPRSYFAVKFRYRAGQEREPEADPRQHRARDRLDDRPRADPRGHRGADGRARSSTSPRTPGPSALQVTVDGKQWWWQFELPGRQGRHRRRAASSRPAATSTCSLDACDGTGAAKTCNVIHSFWVPELAGKKDVVPGQTNTLTLDGRQTRHLPRAVRGVLRPVARQHALPGDRGDPGRLRAVARASSSRAR